MPTHTIKTTLPSTIRINWRVIEGGNPEDGALVAVTGHFQGKPGAGRWVSLARRVKGTFFSDETGDELLTPTHWHEIILPADD